MSSEERLILYALWDGSQADEGMARTAAISEDASARIGGAGEKAGTDFADGIDKGTSGIGGMFNKLGGQMSNFGLPFGNEMQKIGGDLQNVETKGKGLGEAFSAMGGVAIAAFAGIAAESIHLADAFDTVQTSLKTAVTNSGSSWAEYQTQIEAAYKSGAKLGFENVTVAGSLQQLTTATNSPAKALKDLGTAENLMRMQHVSLGDATSELVKTLGGSTRVLTTLGINADLVSGKLHNVQSAEQSLQSATLSVNTIEKERADGQLVGAAASGQLAAALLRQRDAERNLQQAQSAIPDALALINQRVKGTAEAFSKTLPGAMQVAKAETNQLGVQFGSVLEPFLKEAGTEIVHLASDLVECKPILIGLGSVIAVALGASLGATVAKTAGSILTSVGRITTSLEGWVLRSRATSTGIIDSNGVVVADQQAAAARQIAAIEETMAAEQVMAERFEADAAAVFQATGQIDEGITAMAANARANIATMEAQIASLGPTADAAAGGVDGAMGAMEAATETASEGITAALLGTGVGAAAVALGIVATELYTHWQAVMTAINDVTNKMADGVAAALNGLVTAYNDTIGKIPGLHANMHFSGPVNTGPGTYGVNTGTSTAMISGITQAQDQQIQKLVSAGQSLTDAVREIKSGGLGQPIALPKMPGLPKIATSVAVPGSTIPALGAIPSGGVSPYGAPAVTALSPAEVAMENVATRFNSMVKVASAGGTGFSQQGATMAALTRATGGRNASQEAQLVNSLNATQNPTLERMAATIEQTWQVATQKITGIIDTDTTAGQSKLQQLQAAASSSSIGALKNALTPVMRTSLNQMVTELNSTHQKALESLATQLENQWRTTLGDYNDVLKSLATTAKADAINLKAQKLGALTTLAGAESSGRVSVSGGAATLSQNVTSNAAKAIADSSKISQDRMTMAAQAITQAAAVQTAEATKQATSITDAAKIAQDAAQAAATQITDSAKVLSDAAALQVESINAQTTAITDAANAQVASITDTSQTQVDVLGERGLYGLALTAQMSKVALDQATAVNNQQIAAAQAHMDQVTAATNQQVAIEQQRVDIVNQQTASHIAEAQANADLAQQRSDTAIQTATVAAAKAQAHADSVLSAAQLRNDAVTAHADRVIAKAQQHEDLVALQGLRQIATAQDHADASQIASVIEVAEAQAAVDQAEYSNASKQAIAQANQRLASANQTLAQNSAQAIVTAVTDAANTANQNAANAYNATQAAAGKAEAQSAAQLAATQSAANKANASAQASLSHAQSAASILNATTQANLQAVTNAANIAQAQAAAQLSGAQSAADIQQALANQQLTSVQAAANKQEATLQAIYNVNNEMAQVEYRGSGINVYITGVPADNAAAISAATSYALRYKV